MSSVEPWDEIMGPPPNQTNTLPISSSSFEDDDMDDDDDVTQPPSSFKKEDPPPSNYYDPTQPPRWSQYDTDATYLSEQSVMATNRAVYLASKTLADKELERNDHDNDDELVMYEDPETEYDSSDDVYSQAFNPNSSHNNNNNPTNNNNNSRSNHSSSTSSFVVDHDRIRQEALRMLEVAEDTDSNYHVHTKKNKVKVRSALSGINLSSARQNISDRLQRVTNLKNSNRFRQQQAPIDQEQDNDHDQQTDNVLVDVLGMERRNLANRELLGDYDNNGNNNNDWDSNASNQPKLDSEKQSSWSSRYSIDHTLLARTAMTVTPSSVKTMRTHNDPYSASNAKILDQMDREHYQQQQNNNNSRLGGFISKLLGLSSTQQQSSTHMSSLLPQSSRQPNLHAAFCTTSSGIGGTGTENGASSLPPVNMRTKSWQERMLQHQRCQHRVLQVVGMSLIIFILTISSVYYVISKNRQPSSSGGLVGSSSVTFYVTADIPWYGEDESQLVRSFQTMDDHTSFVAHVGNIQEVGTMGCNTNGRYEQIATMLSDSCLVPTFFVPGSQDWNDCLDPISAWDSWYETFPLHYEKRQRDRLSNTNFDSVVDGTQLQVHHQKDHLENWAFLLRDVLFVGVHEVSGTIVDTDEFMKRSERNFDWVEEKIRNAAASNDVRSVVIMGNASPPRSSSSSSSSSSEEEGTVSTSPFFGRLQEFLPSMPPTFTTLYVHSSDNDNENSSSYDATTLYQPNPTQLPNWYAVATKDRRTRNSSTNPLLRINVGFGTNPFIIG